MTLVEAPGSKENITLLEKKEKLGNQNTYSPYFKIDKTYYVVTTYFNRKIIIIYVCKDFCLN